MKISIFYITLLSLLFVSVYPSNYKVTNKSKADNVNYYDLEYQGEQQFYVKNTNKVIKKPQLQVRKEQVDILDFKIVDSQNPDRFEIPDDLPGMEDLYNDIEKPQDLKNNEQYQVTVNEEAFCISVDRKETKEQLFSTCDNAMIYSNMYLQISTKLPTKYIFGLGERNSDSLRLQKGSYTLYGRDEPILRETNKLGNNVYGSHPMYLMRENSGNFHIVFYKYSGGIDVQNDQNSLTYKAIGGIFHFKIFLGDSNPETVIKKYHDYLGGGYMTPPFWSFGYHQSRWGYKDLQKLIKVGKTYTDLNIPIETMWSDLDFMKDKQTFSVNQKLYPPQGYQQLQKDLKLHYVPLVDVAVGSQKYKDDPALVKGKQYDIFCRSPRTGKYFKGSVWPGASYFPDFLNPRTKDFWGEMMEELHDNTNFSGMWLDMNEPANFCNGECTNYTDKYQNEVESEDYYIHGEFDYPYRLGAGHLIHYGGHFHKDVHNLYGLLDTIYTNFALKERLNKPLPFILSRSTFPGSGKYGQHWCGDNNSDWFFLKVSVPQIILFNFFGIPMTGNDVCGFMGRTEAQLCKRWIQAAALQPFFRNHNNDQAPDQEFYNLGKEVQEVARKNLRLRYSLLKYYYSLFIINNGTGTVMKPLFFEFPQDDEVYTDDVMNYQYMVGPSLLATPILEKDVSTITPYFPGQWNDLLTGLQIGGGYSTIFSDTNDILPVFIRYGSVIPYQPQIALRTADLGNDYSLVASLKKDDKYSKKYGFTYYAEGQIMNLQDFQDEQSVIDQCLEANNCILDVIVGVYVKDSTITLQIILENDEKQNILDDLFFCDLYLYNIPHSEQVKINEQIKESFYQYNRLITIKWTPKKNPIYTLALN